MKTTPRVATVQDMSGLGRCSLTVVLPVLSVMGVQCCPLQTAYLSAHTGFPSSDHATFCDLTAAMQSTIRHWQELGMAFDAVYSGFLGSHAQLSLLSECIQAFRSRQTLILVDPVMGDHGKVYRTYTPAMCARMTELARQADLITPNLTEAAILLGEDYTRFPSGEAELRSWLTRLSLEGRRSVVITGVSLSPGQIGAGFFDREDGGLGFCMDREEPQHFSGTGDLFASVLLGALLQGDTLPRAVRRAVIFVGQCAAHTIRSGTPLLHGVCFESQLPKLMIEEAPAGMTGA